jgi:hypothetical protein
MNLDPTAVAFRERVENYLDWVIFSGISLQGASVLRNFADRGRALYAAGDPEQRTEAEAFLIGEAIRMWIPSLLLAGFGLEGLLKAVRIKQMKRAGQGTTVVKKGRVLLVGTLKTHNLVSLARDAGFPTDQAETALLTRLTTIVEWAGRYPVAAAAEQLLNTPGMSAANDGRHVDALAHRLQDFCDRVPETVWTLPSDARAESAKIGEGRWEVKVIVGADVRRRAETDRSSDAFRTALDWRRDFELG